MTRPSPLPPGLLPRWLSRVQAAAYLGVSPRIFDEERKAGRWPAGEPRGLSATKRSLRWDRLALDAASDRLSNRGGGTPSTGPHPTPEEAMAEWAKSA